MDSSTVASIFDGVEAPPKKYNAADIAQIVYVFLSQIIVPVIGIVWFCVDFIYRNPETPTPPSYSLLLYCYLIAAPILGITIRNKMGWTLTASCVYASIAIFLQPAEYGNYLLTAVGEIVLIPVLPFLHTKAFRRLYKISKGDRLLSFHCIAFLIGVVLCILIKLPLMIRN